MHQVGRSYPSDLTNQQWEDISKIIPPARRGGRNRTTSVRRVVDAIFYLNRTGCAWRFLPRDYPPWPTVYDYFRRWQMTGVIEKIRTTLGRVVRKQNGKKEVPSTLIIDSQSVKAQFGENRGYDGFKKVRGRKRHIIVDTLGIICGVRVSAANVGDVQDGLELIKSKKEFLDQGGLQAVYADGGYRNRFEDEVFKMFKTRPTILRGQTILRESKRPEDKGAKRRKILKHNLRPMRWVVERTFAWLNHYRRLARDYERKICYSQAMINLAMIQILLRKLHPS